MALSGSLGNTFRTGLRVQIDWTATQSVTGNYSDVTAKFYIKSLGAYTISSSATKICKITIDGATYSVGVNIALSANQSKLLATYTKRIYHGSNGAKTIGISGSCEISATLGGTYYGTVSIANTNFALDSIPRNSRISSFPNFTIGTDFTITIDRASPNYTHIVSMYVGNTYIGEWGNIGASAVISLNRTHLNRLYSAIPNTTLATVTLMCATYNGTIQDDSTMIGGRLSATAIATVPSSVVPTIASISVSEINTYVSDLAGAFVQGLSNLSISIVGAEGAEFSTIKSYQIGFDGAKYGAKSIETGKVGGSGTFIITATVVDSRGRTASISKSINILPYAPPKITSFSVTRCDSSGIVNALGTYIKATVKGTISSLNSKNQAVARIYSKERTATDYILKNTTTGIVGTTAVSISPIVSGYPILSSFDLQIELSDLFRSASATSVLSTAQVPLSLGKTGVGVGKVWEQGVLDVNGDIYESGIALKNKYSPKAHSHSYLPLTGGSVSGIIDALGLSVSGNDVAEYGSNSNGEYIRFYNGVQICWLRTEVYNQGINTAYGSLYIGQRDWTFPVSFITTPAVTCSEFKHGTGASWGTISSPASTTSVTLRGVDAFTRPPSTSTIVRISAIAIGKWKH